MKKDKDKKSNDRTEYEAEYYQTNKRVRLTFPNSDYAIIEEIATKQGLSVASFIRLATISQAKNLYLFPKELEDKMKETVFNIRKIGNNINQIAKYSNEQRHTNPEMIESLLVYLKDLEEEIKGISLKFKD